VRALFCPLSEPAQESVRCARKGAEETPWVVKGAAEKRVEVTAGMAVEAEGEGVLMVADWRKVEMCGICSRG
jgi:hypothetical protein